MKCIVNIWLYYHCYFYMLYVDDQIIYTNDMGFDKGMQKAS